MKASTLIYNSFSNRMFRGLIRKNKNSPESLKKMEIRLKINIFVIYKKKLLHGCELLFRIIVDSFITCVKQVIGFSKNVITYHQNFREMLLSFNGIGIGMARSLLVLKVNSVCQKAKFHSLFCYSTLEIKRLDKKIPNNKMFIRYIYLRYDTCYNLELTKRK